MDRGFEAFGSYLSVYFVTDRSIISAKFQNRLVLLAQQIGNFRVGRFLQRSQIAFGVSPNRKVIRHD